MADWAICGRGWWMQCTLGKLESRQGGFKAMHTAQWGKSNAQWGKSDVQ